MSVSMLHSCPVAWKLINKSFGFCGFTKGVVPYACGPTLDPVECSYDLNAAGDDSLARACDFISQMRFETINDGNRKSEGMLMLASLT
jgi:hypothetical protein